MTNQLARLIQPAGCLAAIAYWLVFGPSSSSVNGQWFGQLPASFRDSILWSADYEEGDLSDWTFPRSRDPGGGVLNTFEQDVRALATPSQAHSGRYSAEATITKAVRSRNGARAVRLMRWADRPWDQGGKVFPSLAYYSTWMYFPDTYNPNKYPPWDPGDGGWWNVFQFKAHDDNDVSQPTWTLSIQHRDETKEMSFYLYSPINPPSSFLQASPRPIPIERWFHLEALYKASLDGGGAITVWQDGVQILDVANVRTIVSKEHFQVVWGIGNYTDHIAGGPIEGAATIFFDDSMVSTQPISPFISSGTNPK